MCFSASASFGAAVVLSAIGVITVKQTKKPSHFVFAFIPILFAVQQVSEGFVWLALQNPEYAQWQSVPIHVFMVFAHIIWPSWIVFAAVLIEKEKARKKILSVLLGVAFFLSASEIYSMIMYSTRAEIRGHHVQYLFNYPKPYLIATEVLYAFTIILPCFISSVRKMWLLGIAFTVSFIVSTVFFKVYLLSVWCFFAAVMSILIYLIIDSDQGTKDM